MWQQFNKLVHELSHQANVDPKTLDEVFKRLKEDKRITKNEGTMYHFNAFLVPIDFKKRKIYLGHHIKAADWIPPGGHIEPGELPIDAVRREFQEELDFKLTNEKIEMVNMSIKDINKPDKKCMRHYDFWCLVHIDERPFRFLRKEFYDASWVDFDEALKRTKTPQFLSVMKKIFKR